MPTLRPALYMFPSELSPAPLQEVLPPVNIELISAIKHFIVENVRTARRFLKKCNRDIDIDSLTFYTLNVDTDPAEIPAMLAPLAAGEPMGVISEAGCPAVADPGALAVAEAHRRGLEVVPLVGPSSILLALIGSGFNGQCFIFNGYLPVDRESRADTLRRLYREACSRSCTQIFIETPYRNNRMIADIIAALPHSAQLCVASDLTGPAQRITSMTVGQWAKVKPDYDKTPAIFLIYK